MGTVSVESCWRGEHSLLEFLAFSELLRAYVYSLPNSGKLKIIIIILIQSTVITKGGMDGTFLTTSY